LLAVGIGAADHAQEQGITRRTRYLRGRGQVMLKKKHAFAGAAAHIGGGNFYLRAFGVRCMCHEGFLIMLRDCAQAESGVFFKKCSRMNPLLRPEGSTLGVRPFGKSPWGTKNHRGHGPLLPKKTHQIYEIFVLVQINLHLQKP
jgi:hypothetical protein